MAKAIDELPSNIQIVMLDGRPTQAFVFYLQSMQKTTESGTSDLTAFQKELDDTQTGAGLNTGGNYVASTTSNYINLATSLFNADLLLDSAIFNNVREVVTTVTSDASLLAASQTILADATSNVINVTLPDPSTCFSNNRSLKFGITKIDTTSNIVNILPFGSELIVGETSQYLQQCGEILNFITDGTNWYLQN